MPRPLNQLHPDASWTALFGAALQRLRLAQRSHPVMSQRELGRRVGADDSTISAIERGLLRPDEKFVERCEQELQAAGVLHTLFTFVNREWDDWKRLGVPPQQGSTPPPAALLANPAQITDAGQLKALSDEAAEATELAEHAEASSIGAGTLDGLDRAVDRYCRDYPSMAPDVLAVRVRRRLRDVHRLLGGKLTPTQHRHLVVAGGWLATLLACLQFDLGQREAAERTRDAAFQLAKEGEHQEIMAWTFELLAWFALVDCRYQDTVDYARAGLELAPSSSAGVQLAVQEARAWSRLGNRREAEHAMRHAGTALTRLPVPSHPEHHFVFDAAKLSFYAAMCYTWLGEADRAEEHAQEVVARSLELPGIVRWPTRLAIARLDLGLIAAQRGQADEAGQLGIVALASGRVVASTLEWFAELDAVLLRDYGDAADAQDFHDRYVTARRALHQRAAS
jgi:transcriptional regulator with XRE-family HTH domain